MVLFRAAGWLSLALALGAVVYDCLSWWSDGALRLSALGDLWSRLDPGSLNAARAGLQHVLSGVLWNGLLSPILGIPALPAFVIAGFLCLWIGGRIGGRGAAPTRFLGGSRPRSRRSRGLS